MATDHKAGRHFTNGGVNHLPSVTCSHKLCQSPHHRGPRWTLVTHFHVAEWTDESKTVPKRFQAYCKTCMVIYSRIRKGYNPRTPSKLGIKTGPKGYEPETPEEREIYREYSRQRYENMTEEQRKNRVEYWRIRAEVKRREQGIKPRNLKRLQRSTLSMNRRLPEPDEPTLPVAPLAGFLEEAIRRHGRASVALAAGIGTKRLDALRAGVEDPISLELADRILVGLGYPEQLALLYPHDEGE